MMAARTADILDAVAAADAEGRHAAGAVHEFQGVGQRARRTGAVGQEAGDFRTVLIAEAGQLECRTKGCLTEGSLPARCIAMSS